MNLAIGIAAIIAAYALGSLSGSLLLGHRLGIDIRTRGSGNAGGTNALRTLGWRFALGVAVIDISKGVLAALLGQQLNQHMPGLSSLFAPLPLPHLMTLAAAIGHTWPVFYGFRGGKGAGTLMGGLLLLWPMAVLMLFGVWCLSLITVGYVGLSTIIATAALIPLSLWKAPDVFHLALIATCFVMFTHRSNVQRLLHGTEHRFEQARLIPRALHRLRRHRSG